MNNSNKLINLMRHQAMAVMSTFTHMRMGQVSAYDPANHCAKVIIQPEETETGWLPIGTNWVGNGWGMFTPPSIGDMVKVHFQEGDFNAGIIGMRAHNNIDRPLNVPSGECWLVHQSGSFIKLTNDGSIQIQGNTTITGNLTVTGDILDNSGSNANTVKAMRTIYNAHDHPDPQGGNTGTPSGSM